MNISISGQSKLSLVDTMLKEIVREETASLSTQRENNDNFIRGPDPPISDEEYDRLLARLNEVFEPHRLSFSMERSAGQVVVKVIDKETNEVIRQIPSEEILSMREMISSQRGMLINQRI